MASAAKNAVQTLGIVFYQAHFFLWLISQGHCDLPLFELYGFPNMQDRCSITLKPDIGFDIFLKRLLVVTEPCFHGPGSASF